MEYKQGVLFNFPCPDTETLLKNKSVKFFDILSCKTKNLDSQLRILNNLIEFVENKSTFELENI